MNTELIQKLKSQCIVREMRGTNAFDNYMVDRFDTEKFASLIIEYCTQTLVNHGYTDAAIVLETEHKEDWQVFKFPEI